MLQQPFQDQPGLPSSIEVSASVGIARWADNASDADSLIEAADTAMYDAKQQGDGPIAIAAPIAKHET